MKKLMSEALGLAAHEAPRAPTYLGAPQLPESRTYSERTAESLDDWSAADIPPDRPSPSRPYHARSSRILT